MEKKFEDFKNEILRRAKAAYACKPEYSRAYSSETFAGLMQVIKDNFQFAVDHKVIEVTIIEEYKEEFNANMIWCNVDCSAGYLLLNNATVIASGNATVIASDNATVKAWGNAKVIASDNAKVIASDNATVIASGNATVIAWGNATVIAWGNATVIASGNATVIASGNATVKASDNAKVKASGNAYIASYCMMECQLSDNAIYRIIESNTIKYSSDNIKFKNE